MKKTLNNQKRYDVQIWMRCKAHSRNEGSCMREYSERVSQNITKQIAKYGRRQGNIMIESLVAISIAVMGLMGIVTLLSRSLAITNDIEKRLVATYLATEGIEIVKNLLDTNMSLIGKDFSDGNPARFAWSEGILPGKYEVTHKTEVMQSGRGGLEHDETFVSLGGESATELPRGEDSQTPLIINPETGTYEYGGSVSSPFVRTVEIEELDVDEDSFVDGLRIISTVRWKDRDEDQDVSLEAHFFDWREETE